MSLCSSLEVEEEVVEFLNDNLERHYETTRAPLVLSFNTNWLAVEEQLEGLKLWIDEILNGRRNDIFFVTMGQLIAWMEKPTAVTSIPQFEPWQCNSQSFTLAENEASCEEANGCDLRAAPNGNRGGFMFTCNECPTYYPDVNSPNGEEEEEQFPLK